MSTTPISPPTPPTPLLLTVEEAASVLAVSPRTVRRMIASGELRAVRVRRDIVRIRPVDLQAFLDNLPEYRDASGS